MLHYTLWQWFSTLFNCLEKKHGRRQTFFQGRAKIFQGGQEPTFSLKTTKKIPFFPKKSKNILFFCQPWGAQRAKTGKIVHFYSVSKKYLSLFDPFS
jgi:hypothetical protein